MVDDKRTSPGVSLTTSSDPATIHETAYSIAEEFVRMGHDGPKILRMFQNPFYASAHGAYRSLGHNATAAIIDKCLAGTGRACLAGEAGDTTAAFNAPQKVGR